jgi:hypothetical protein
VVGEVSQATKINISEVVATYDVKASSYNLGINYEGVVGSQQNITEVVSYA